MRAPATKRFHLWSNHLRRYAAASKTITNPAGRRNVQIQAAPSSDASGPVENTPGSASSPGPDAVFEVIGSPYSLLSVTLSPSQPLHTRRGTLVALCGDPTTTVSTLSLLSPLRRALIGIPFLYQRLTSTTPITALIAPRSTCTSLAVLHLTGTTDWKVAQRKALLAWTGNTLDVTPSLNRRLDLAHWGTTTCTGRGLLALVGTGNLFSISLTENETYIAHPSNILAYSVSSPTPPRPYRFKSSTLNLQIPQEYRFGTFSSTLSSFFPATITRFLQTVKRDSETYRVLANLLHRIRTWSRRTIWGDRLFLQFTGPTTILVQSRASRVADVLTNRDVDEIAHAPPGVVQETVELAIKRQRDRAGDGDGHGHGHGGDGGSKKAAVPETVVRKPPKLSIASVQRDGKVKIEETDGFEQLKR